MRLLGILLLLGGLYFAIAKPWFSTQFTGEIVEASNLFSKGDGWRAGSVQLNKDDGPFRTRINVYRLSGKIRSGERLSLIFRLQDAQSGAIAVERQLTVDLAEASNNPRSDVEQMHSIATEAFDIPADGSYKLGVAPVSSQNPNRVDLNIHPNITRVESITSENVEAAGGDNVFTGALMIGAGILLMSLAGNRRKRKSQPVSRTAERQVENVGERQAKDARVKPIQETSLEPQKSPEPQKEPSSDVGKTIKWGRDAGKKR